MVRGTYHTKKQRTVAAELCSAGSLDRNPEVTLDSMSSTAAELGQVKTGGKGAKTHHSSLSKSSCSPARDREERARSFAATNIADTEKIVKASGI